MIDTTYDENSNREDQNTRKQFYFIMDDESSYVKNLETDENGEMNDDDGVTLLACILMAALLAFGVLGAFLIMFPEEFGYHGDKSSSSVKLQTISDTDAFVMTWIARNGLDFVPADEIVKLKVELGFMFAEKYETISETDDFVMKWIARNGLDFVPAVEIVMLKEELRLIFAKKYTISETDDFVMKWIAENPHNQDGRIKIAMLKEKLRFMFAKKYGKEKLEERHKELEKRHKENEELRKKIEAGKKEEALNKLRIETLENSKKAP